MVGQRLFLTTIYIIIHVYTYTEENVVIVLFQTCSVFLAHLEAHVSATALQPPELILTHQAALCLISALVKGVCPLGGGYASFLESMMIHA